MGGRLDALPGVYLPAIAIGWGAVVAAREDAARLDGEESTWRE